MGGSDPAGRILLLKPDTRNLNTAGHGNYPFNPSGVDQCRALWTRIFTPNFWQALSNNPDHLEATWQKLKTVMKPGKLDPLTKEIIALAVSITNNCTY